MVHPSLPEFAAPRLTCIVLDTGYCTASERMMMRGGRNITIACHAIVALLHHPRHGWTLWDTGYAPRMLQETRKLPWSLYRRLTPLVLDENLAVVAQLAHLGLQAHDIKQVVISHFHADHVAGLRDFPDAELIAHAEAYADVLPRRGLSALGRGIIPALLPKDFAERARLLPTFNGPPLTSLGPTYDLFGDGSMRLVELPGHAKGQIGMLARTTDGDMLFVADGCWLREAVRRQAPPHPMTRFMVDDYAAVAETIQRLHEFSFAHPMVELVPTHCPEAFAERVVRPHRV